MKERYYSLSLLYGLAYDDDVNGNCDGMIDFTVIDSISGADVEKVRHGKWEYNKYGQMYCSQCGLFPELAIEKPYCSYCGTKMDGGKE